MGRLVNYVNNLIPQQATIRELEKINMLSNLLPPPFHPICEIKMSQTYDDVFCGKKENS